MAFTPEQEAALLNLIAQPAKIISDLESEVSLNGDELIPVEDGSGTFGATVNDIADYTIDQIPAATESVAGIAKIATQAETNTGTDDARFITPLKLRFGFAASFAASGYIAFPSWLGGFIIQWGTTTTSGSADVTVTFPFAFPTAAASIVLTQNNALTQGAWASVVSKTTSNFTCSGWTANTNRQLIGVNWYAIGY